MPRCLPTGSRLPHRSRSPRSRASRPASTPGPPRPIGAVRRPRQRWTPKTCVRPPRRGCGRLRAAALGARRRSVLDHRARAASVSDAPQQRARTKAHRTIGRRPQAEHRQRQERDDDQRASAEPHRGAAGGGDRDAIAPSRARRADTGPSRPRWRALELTQRQRRAPVRDAGNPLDQADSSANAERSRRARPRSPADEPAPTPHTMTAAAAGAASTLAGTLASGTPPNTITRIGATPACAAMVTASASATDARPCEWRGPGTA